MRLALALALCARAMRVFGDDPFILEPRGCAMLIFEIPLEKRRRMFPAFCAHAHA